jgi:hypothetical protein
MTDTLPVEVSVTTQPGGVTYRLPARNVGGYRYVGLGALLFGLLLCCAPLLPTWKLYLALSGQILPGDGLLWLGGWMLSAPMCIGGLHLVPIGLFILAGHSEIELHHGTLHSVESWGPISWRWERSTAELRRFYVSEGLDALNLFSTVTIAPQCKLCVITPEWKPEVGTRDPRPMWLAPGYPRSWLTALANDLARRCLQPADEPTVTAPAAPTVPVVETSPDLSDYEELAEQPAGSAIALEESARGLRFTVPPLGFRHSVGWLVGSLLASLVAFGLTENIVQGGKPFGSIEVSLVVAAGLWAMGIGFLLAGVNLARRRAVLSVVGDTLLVEQTNLFGTTAWQWRGQQLADIFVMLHPGSSDTPDHWELEIHPQSGAGDELHLLGYRHPAELRWLATRLRRALRCTGQSAKSPPAGLVVSSPFRLGRQNQ